MLLVNEFSIFLVRLKLGLFEQDLAYRLMIHRSSVCRKLITWSSFMYFLLGCHMIWPSRDDVNGHMPEGFKKLYPSTRLILTCTQIFVQTPTSLLLQSQHYSTYKSNTTLKGLIGITPNGAIFMKWLAGLLPRQSFLKERENKCFMKLQELLLWLGGSVTRQSDFFDYRATSSEYNFRLGPAFYSQAKYRFQAYARDLL